jgi:antitoxin component YwqK of YwqJK toxin-antitoxin module
MIRLFGIFLLTVAGIVAANLAPPQAQDLADEGLRGPVRRVDAQSEDSITIDGHTSQAGAKTLVSLIFDKKGRLVERIDYDADGSLRRTDRYSHDRNGLLIASQSFDEKGKPEDKQTYSYRDGKLREALTYDADGKLTLKEALRYDANGRLVAEDYFAGGILRGKTTFTTGADGNVSEAAFFRPDGSKAIAPIGPCYNAHRVSYSYDDQRRLSEETSYELNGNAKQRTTYRYDSRGNIVEKHIKDGFSTIDYIHQYEYDARGSWTRETVQTHTTRAPLFGDKPDTSDRTIITTRKITYY